jgi:hypothetical protein
MHVADGNANKVIDNSTPEAYDTHRCLFSEYLIQRRKKIMKKIWPLFWFLALVAILFLLAGCSSSTKAPASTDVTSQPASLDGAALVQERCTACHSISRVESARQDAAGWKILVDSMVKRGAKLNADEQKAVIDYLAATYPK